MEKRRTAIEKLKHVQELLHLNQRELGVYAGVSTRTVNSWMTGDRKCQEWTAELIERIAIADAKAIEAGEPTSGMWRWCLIEMRKYGLEDEHVTVYGSKVDAMRDAECVWNHLTEREKKHVTEFFVAKSYVQVTEERAMEPRFDVYEYADGSVFSEAYDIAKDWLEDR